MDFKNIHIGKMIEMKVKETNTDVMQICSFLKCNEDEINQTYSSKQIDSQVLLNWCKLLKYDFFRVYSQHLLLFSSSVKEKKQTNKKRESSTLPQFRRNIYTKEIIEFILDSVNSGEKTKQEIINTYQIPKTTLYKWFSKYNFNQNGTED